VIGVDDAHERFTGLAGMTPDGPWSDDLALAHRIADIAGEIALRHRHHPRTRWKWDGSPVTEADLEIDQAIHELLRAERPDDGVLTEERSERPGSSGRRWIIDPLDGTSLYAYGDPGWGTLIAVQDHDDLVLGLAHYPVDRRRYWAASGAGAHRAVVDVNVDGPTVTPVVVSDVENLSEARATAWQREDLPGARRLRAATRWQVPDQYFLSKLLDGDLDVLYSTGGEIWDHAAGVAILTEAGGSYRDHHGGRRIDRRGGIYTNGLLEAAVVGLLGGTG
jgi:histidinol-phosphatase